MAILTFSSASCFHRCRRQYYWRYIRELKRKREEDSDALATGNATHRGMEVYAKTGSVNEAKEAIRQWEESLPTLGPDIVRRRQQACRASACVQVAAEKWSDPVSEPEKCLDCPIHNPATLRTSRNYRFAGVRDGRQNGMIVDWKTTADPSRFVKLMSLSCQTECYALAELEGVDGAEYRIIRTPSIKLKLAGARRKADQTREEYEAECIEWIRQAENGAMTWFQYVSPARLNAARHWLWDTQQALSECKRSERWFFNAGACHDWSRECSYMLLCQAVAAGDDVEALVEIDYERSDPLPELTRARATA